MSKKQTTNKQSGRTRIQDADFAAQAQTPTRAEIEQKMRQMFKPSKNKSTKGKSAFGY